MDFGCRVHNGPKEKPNKHEGHVRVDKAKKCAQQIRQQLRKIIDGHKPILEHVWKKGRNEE